MRLTGTQATGNCTGSAPSTAPPDSRPLQLMPARHASAGDDAAEDWCQVTTVTTQAATAPGRVTGLTAVNASDQSTCTGTDPDNNGGWDHFRLRDPGARQGKSSRPIRTLRPLRPATFVAVGPTLPTRRTLTTPPGTRQNRLLASSNIADSIADTLDGTDEAPSPIRRSAGTFRVYAVTTDDATLPADTVTTSSVAARAIQPGQRTRRRQRATLRHDSDSQLGTLPRPTGALDPDANSDD